MINKTDMKAFMEAHFLCVIATVGEGNRPEAAYVGYTSNDELELIIGTSNKTRKYKNLMQNKSVALVIADQSGEVQYEGAVEVLSYDDYESLIADKLFKKLPGLDKYRKDPTQVYLRIKPTWARFIMHGENDQINEFTEFA